MVELATEPAFYRFRLVLFEFEGEVSGVPKRCILLKKLELHRSIFGVGREAQDSDETRRRKRPRSAVPRLAALVTLDRVEDPRTKVGRSFGASARGPLSDEREIVTLHLQAPSTSSTGRRMPLEGEARFSDELVIEVGRQL
jgi:hypothetical protein